MYVEPRVLKLVSILSCQTDKIACKVVVCLQRAPTMVQGVLVTAGEKVSNLLGVEHGAEEGVVLGLND